jgi:hypothetical protein
MDRETLTGAIVPFSKMLLFPKNTIAPNRVTRTPTTGDLRQGMTLPSFCISLMASRRRLLTVLPARWPAPERAGSQPAATADTTCHLQRLLQAYFGVNGT